MIDLLKANDLYSLNPNVLLDDEQAADYLGVKASTLAVWRCTDRYPLTYIKIGRKVRYRVKDILRFIDNSECSS